MKNISKLAVIFILVAILVSSVTGCTGEQGVVGLTGPQGLQGIQGPQGEPGPEGPQGPQGAQGTPGADGTDGADGQDGADGSDGIQGPQGDQGIQGVSGIDGAMWLNGTGAPSGSLGVVGDFYLDNDNGWIYEKTGTSTWEHQITLAIDENFKSIRTVIKSGNAAKTDDTALSDDSELIIPLSYYCTYVVDGCIFFKTNGEADFQFAFFPADEIYEPGELPRDDIPDSGEWDSIQAYMDVGVSCGDTTTQNSLSWDYYGSTVNSTTILVDDEMVGVVFISGIITIEMGLEFGEPAFLFRWAQNTSSTYETTVLAGSYLSVMCVEGDDNLADWKIDVID